MYIIYGLFANEEVFYIGKTTAARLVKRYNEHQSKASKGGNQKVYNKLRKLLREGVSIELKPLFNFETEREQTQKEIELIAEYGIKTRNGGKLYNSTVGGEGITGWNHTIDAKRKMSEAKKGNTSNVGRKRPDTIARFAKPVFVYNLEGDFVKEHASSRDLASVLGISYKIVHKAIDNRIVSRVYSPSLDSYVVLRSSKFERIEKYEKPTPKSIKVVQYTPDMEFVATFKDAVRASEATGVHACSIRNVCTGKQKTAGGYLWQYKPTET